MPTISSRAEKAAALERWADDVQSEVLVPVDTAVLRILEATRMPVPDVAALRAELDDARMGDA